MTLGIDTVVDCCRDAGARRRGVMDRGVPKQGPQALFERARLLEENSKTLGEAIALYKQVVTRRPDPIGRSRRKRSLRAAECHQKLGDGQATGLYEQIIREYWRSDRGGRTSADTPGLAWC